MALKACRECGKEISTDARACPHCGKKRGGRFLKLFSIAVAVVFLLLIFGGRNESGRSYNSGGSSSNAEYWRKRGLKAAAKCDPAEMQAVRAYTGITNEDVNSLTAEQWVKFIEAMEEFCKD